jgi:tRNA U34 5-carboxymethylaminomethyl modifying enzyme MnmG/GidA
MFFNTYFHGANGAQIISFIPFYTDTTLISVVENQIKYEGYIKRQLEEIEKYRRNEDTALPSDMDYDSIKVLSSEVHTQYLACLRIIGLNPSGF